MTRRSLLLFPHGEFLMPSHPWCSAAWLFALLLGLTACTGNYKFNDDQYRPLGEPQAINRGR